MTRSLKITTFLLLFLLLALFNMAMAPSAQEFLSPTETPNRVTPADTATLVRKVGRATATSTRPPTSPAPTRTRVATLSLEMQAGHSDGIAVIGILIVAIIIIPIMLKYKEWRVH